MHLSLRESVLRDWIHTFLGCSNQPVLYFCLVEGSSCVCGLFSNCRANCQFLQDNLQPGLDFEHSDREKLLSASELDTHKSLLWGAAWPDAPHRVLRTKFVEAHSGKEGEGQKPAPPDAPTIGTRIVGGVKKEMKPFQVCFPPRQLQNDFLLQSWEGLLFPFYVRLKLKRLFQRAQAYAYLRLRSK